METRPPAVAGTFYPAAPDELGSLVDGFLADAKGASKVTPAPAHAYVVPHAGLVYSGPVAARAYAHLQQSGVRPRTVLLVGPAHRTPSSGLALSGAAAFETPLGAVAIDAERRARLVAEGLVRVDDGPHLREHCLEVQLPFLQRVVPGFEILPVLGGDASPEAVGALLEALWDDAEVLVVLSSDLSHYLPYDEARVLDGETATLLEALDPRALEPGRACGRVGLGGLVALGARRPLTLERLDLRSSGDTAGPRAEVVGYGAWAVRDA